jgi:peptidyl-prolyl cis-trans isomerase D
VTEALTADVKPEQEQVWARHILVTDEATAKAVLDRLNKGEDWAKVAAEVSTDETTKNQAGDLGWFAKGQQAVEFEQAAFALEIGKISQPVKTSAGYQIIQVLGHEVRPLTASEFQDLKTQTFNDWLTKQSEGTDIQKFEDNWTGEIPVEPTLPPNIVQQ